MWTPRRILLLLAGLAGAVGAYIGYAAVLGGVDGLPELPAAYRYDPDGPDPVVPLQVGDGPTVVRLARAFGINSPEARDLVSFKVKIEERSKNLALASGQPVFAPAAEKSPVVVVAPFSVAFFGKPDPTDPLSVEEISSFHAERAELEFDRPVATLQDMTKAKLVAMRMESTPDVLSTDPRRGQIEIVSNQKSADPGQFLVFRTAGPVYYRDPDAGRPATAPANAEVAQVWTTAAVEVTDRKNLPRPLRSTSYATGDVTGDDLRRHGAVADILLGKALPPPTITAVGMKIFLNPSPKAGTPEAAKAGDKKNTVGYTNVRRIELSEQVQFNLWADGGSGFPGSTPAPVATAATAPKKPLADPPAALTAVVGSAADAAAVAGRLAGRSLLVAETQGGFQYDFPTALAQFETASAADTSVSVTRVAGNDKQDLLFCEKLVVQLAGGPGTADKDKKAAPAAGTGGLKIESLTATGKHVFVDIEAEQMQAQGTELLYAVDAKVRRTVTTLRGFPVTAARTRNGDRNELTAGAAGVRGEVVIVGTDPDPAAKDQRKRTAIAVNGPGEAGLYDPVTKGTTVRARWQKSLTQDRVRLDTAEQDLLKFDGDAEFADTKADMTLRADRLWLWLAVAGAPQGVAPVAPGDQPAKPTRLDALGAVAVQSPDLVVQNTDQMRLFFRDAAPPPALPKATPAVVARAGTPGTAAAEPAKAEPKLATAPPPEPPPVKPKPPIVLAARTIDSTLVRYPSAPATPTAPAPGAGPAAKPAAAFKYEMERAVCVDRVVAHQDPADPAKSPRGLDIAGDRLTLTADRVNGEVAQAMTVTMNDKEGVGQVHFEALSLYGPVINIDQGRNTASVDGVGMLIMPAASDMAGNPSSKPTELEVRWTGRMLFQGALASAEFLGRVSAVQQPARPGLVPQPAPVKVATVGADGKPVPVPPEDTTWTRSRLLCHRLDVTFDKPVYFNQFRRETPAPKPGEAVASNAGPKLKRAFAMPLPDDEAAKRTGPADALVTYTDEAYSKPPGTADAKLIKQQKLVGRDIEVAIADRQQNLQATGPGELRILQPDGGGEFGRAAPAPASAGTPAALKLTLVKFTSRMTGVDKAKKYQDAVFDNGARVWQMPTADINLPFVDHAPPAKTVHLASDDSLTVASSRPTADGPADQTLTAVGNGSFYDEMYEGTANTIKADGQKIVFDGSGDQLARLQTRSRGVGREQGQGARQWVYNKDGHITSSGAAGGLFIR